MCCTLCPDLGLGLGWERWRHVPMLAGEGGQRPLTEGTT